MFKNLLLVFLISWHVTLSAGSTEAYLCTKKFGGSSQANMHYQVMVDADFNRVYVLFYHPAIGVQRAKVISARLPSDFSSKDYLYRFGPDEYKTQFQFYLVKSEDERADYLAEFERAYFVDKTKYSLVWKTMDESDVQVLDFWMRAKARLNEYYSDEQITARMQPQESQAKTYCLKHRRPGLKKDCDRFDGQFTAEVLAKRWQHYNNYHCQQMAEPY